MVPARLASRLGAAGSFVIKRLTASAGVAPGWALLGAAAVKSSPADARDEDSEDPTAACPRVTDQSGVRMPAGQRSPNGEGGVFAPGEGSMMDRLLDMAGLGPDDPPSGSLDAVGDELAALGMVRKLARTAAEDRDWLRDESEGIDEGVPEAPSGSGARSVETLVDACLVAVAYR